MKTDVQWMTQISGSSGAEICAIIRDIQADAIANLDAELAWAHRACSAKDAAIRKHLPALKKMAAQIVHPQSNIFSKMVEDFEEVSA